MGLLGVVLFYLWLSASTTDVRNGLAYATFVFVIAYTFLGALRILVAIGRCVIVRISSKGANARVASISGEEDLLIPRAKQAPRG